VPRVVARRREGYAHDVETDGHTLVSDEPVSEGGSDLGPSPTRLLAAALATCTATTMELYAERKGWDIGKVEVVVDMEYGQPSIPKSFMVTLKLPKELSEEQLERLKQIAGKCPVHRALTNQTDVVIDDRIEPF
jgi:putative redox protein